MRLGTGSVEAKRSGVGQIVYRHRQCGNIRHVICAGIIAVEDIEKFDERGNFRALSDFKRPADTQVRLQIRSAAELIERGLDAVNHCAIVAAVAQSIDVHRRG